MRFRTIGIALIGMLGTHSPAYSDETPPTTFIDGGTQVPTGRFPAVGQLPGCTGSLIGPDMVLTAAHCVCTGQTTPTGCRAQTTFTLTDVRPVDDPNTSQNESEVRTNVAFLGAVRVHPLYTSAGWLSHDFALLKLNRPVSEVVLGVNPMELELPSGRPELGDQLTMVGYGLTGSNCSAAPQGKRELTLPLWEIFPDNETLRIGTQEAGACPGDSGGPAVNPDGKIVGVASSKPGNYDPVDLAYGWIHPDTFVVGANGVRGSHFEPNDKHQFHLVSAYPVTPGGIITYEWNNVRDPGPASFIRRLNVINKSPFPVHVRQKVTPVRITNVPHVVETDKVASVAANGKHGLHFERFDRHQLYLESVYPTTPNGRLSYRWDNVRDPGGSGFIRRLTVQNKSDFRVDFKVKVIRLTAQDQPTANQGLFTSEVANKTVTVAANGKHGVHFERTDVHKSYIASVYPTTVGAVLTYEWDNVRDPGASGFIRRLTVTNPSDFPVTFRMKVVEATAVEPPILSPE